MLVVIPGSIAALSSAFLLYLTHFVPLDPWAQKALGIALLLGLAFVNARGAKLGAGVQNVFTILKVAGHRQPPGGGPASPAAAMPRTSPPRPRPSLARASSRPSGWP